MVPSLRIVIFEPPILVSILGCDGRRINESPEHDENQEEGVVHQNREAFYERAT